MSSFLSMIGVLILVLLLGKLIKEYRKRKAFERVYIEGQPRSMHSILSEVSEDIGLPSSITARISPFIYAAAVDIRRAIHKKEMSYRAVMAYFAAGALRGLSMENQKNGDSPAAEQFLDYAEQFKVYARNCALADHPAGD